MKNIESIILHCENCETIKIEGRHIGVIQINGLTQNIGRHGDKIKYYKTCSDFVLEIHRDANTRYKTFGMISDALLFERISDTPDIITITIKYDDGTIDDDIYVCYKGKNSFFINEYQKVYKSKIGHLYIVCSKENTINDYFDIGYINDEKAMNIHWKMIKN
jgi:hypothetical protein